MPKLVLLLPITCRPAFVPTPTLLRPLDCIPAAQPMATPLVLFEAPLFAWYPKDITLLLLACAPLPIARPESPLACDELPKATASCPAVDALLPNAIAFCADAAAL